MDQSIVGQKWVGNKTLKHCLNLPRKQRGLAGCTFHGRKWSINVQQNIYRSNKGGGGVALVGGI